MRIIGELHREDIVTAGSKFNMSTPLSRRQSYRTGVSVFFHQSTYLRSRARCSPRLYVVWGKIVDELLHAVLCPLGRVKT